VNSKPRIFRLCYSFKREKRLAESLAWPSQKLSFTRSIAVEKRKLAF